jgi:hypothetical protein
MLSLRDWTGDAVRDGVRDGCRSGCGSDSSIVSGMGSSWSVFTVGCLVFFAFFLDFAVFLFSVGASSSTTTESRLALRFPPLLICGVWKCMVYVQRLL